MEEILYEKQNIELVDVQRPFQGLRSYEEKNKAQFGGRDSEIRELFSLVEANRLTIVFGKSGIGKTSLINAGLIPELQKNYFFPVYIRIDYSSDKTPLDQARELIYKKLKTADATISEIGERTLWEYFSNQKLFDGLLTPVLIFDQFEEIFTIGKEKNNNVQEFIIELSDLAENRIPMVVQQERQNRSEMISSLYSEPDFHVIISLREDYLAQLESLKRYLPSIKESRFRVIQMTALQAMDAVMKPAKKLIEKDVAAEIIKKLPGISDLDFETPTSDLDNVKRFVVEPFLLSLICYEINEKRIEKKLDKINPELVAQFDISDVINSYYAKTMQGFSDNVQRGIEDSMLTEGGFRKLQSLEELESEYKINNNEIQQLIEKRIIRKELRDGVEYVELIHDVLTPVIKARRDKRIIELQEKEKTEAIKRAIATERAKKKKFIGTVLLIMGTAITVLLLIAANERIKNSKYERKDRQVGFAKQLLITASIVSNAYADDTTAALISRTAYLINKENNGGHDIDFYNSMYKYSYTLLKFEIANVDSTAIRDIVNAGNDIFYFACTNGKIYRKNGIDSSEQLFYDFKRRLTSIAISPDKKKLAVSGFSDSVKIFDLTNQRDNPISLYAGGIIGSGKSVCFTEDGRLILRLDSAIIGWEVNSWKKNSWNQKIQIEVNNKSHRPQKSKMALEETSNFESNSSTGKFSSIAVFKNKIAIGADSVIILISSDSVFKIKSDDIGSPTSIEFDPSSKYLFIGNTTGTLCRMSLADFSTEFNQFQTARITDIVFSRNGNYMASASYDQTIGVWDIKNNWNSLTPSLFPSPDIQTNIYCVAFSDSSDYVLSGYWNGKILKWPVNPDILAHLICSNVNSRLDTAVTKKVMKQDFNIKEFEKDTCNLKSKIK
jgi:WD40 repeat protein